MNKPTPLPFPLKGLDETWAYRKQVPGTTPSARNVRPVDPILQRLRGGQRHGLSKFFDDIVDENICTGANPVQAIGQVSAARSSELYLTPLVSQFESTFTQADGMLEAYIVRLSYAPGSAILSTLVPWINGQVCKDNNAGAPGTVWTGTIVGNDTVERYLYILLTVGTEDAVLAADGVTNVTLTPDVSATISAKSLSLNWYLHATATGLVPCSPLVNTALVTTAVAPTKGPAVLSNVFSGAGMGIVDEINMAIAAGVTMPALGSTYRLRANVILDAPWGQDVTVGRATCPAVGFVFRAANPAAASIASTGYALAGLFVNYAASPADCHYAFISSPTDGVTAVALTVAAGYTEAWLQQEHVLELMVKGNTVALFLDGLLVVQKTCATNAGNTGFGVFGTWGNGAGAYAPTSVSLDSFTAYTARLSESRRLTHIVTVADGSVYAGEPDIGLLTPLGGDSVLSTSRLIRMCAGYHPTIQNQVMYLVDGLFADYHIYNPVTLIVSDWAATAPGVLPRGTVTNTIGAGAITLYRGRIVLYDLAEEPQNWFMSAVNNPLDWDYAPAVTTETQAVKGSSADCGLVGDILKCCMPYSDDVMIMGCDHTLWAMRGDPAAGGVIDNLSNSVGIVGPEAAAWSPNRTLYFFGGGTIWRITEMGASPEPLSRGRMDKTFAAIDVTLYRVWLIWDVVHYGLHIFMVPRTQQAVAPLHYYWDQRTDSFWQDQYPTAMGPSCAHVYDGDSIDDRATLIGGFDGYIRCTDIDAMSDDGTAITSYVDFGPYVAGDQQRLKMTRLALVMGAGATVSATAQVYAGTSAEAVMTETTPAVAKAVLAGRQTLTQHVTGNALRVRLGQTGQAAKTWAYETGELNLVPAGIARHGRM
ncbi:MAG: hypothetical protein IMZ50_03310 [Candidatus Atribacteria bacterium]|nr:hypothetical protein [Candidatus Atribacteria bacterium]